MAFGVQLFIPFCSSVVERVSCFFVLVKNGGNLVRFNTHPHGEQEYKQTTRNHRESGVCLKRRNNTKGCASAGKRDLRFAHIMGMQEDRILSETRVLVHSMKPAEYT